MVTLGVAEPTIVWLVWLSSDIVTKKRRDPLFHKEPQSNIIFPIRAQTIREPQTSTTKLIVSINKVIGAEKYQSSKAHISSECSGDPNQTWSILKMVDQTWACGIRVLEGQSEPGWLKIYQNQLRPRLNSTVKSCHCVSVTAAIVTKKSFKPLCIRRFNLNGRY